MKYEAERMKPILFSTPMVRAILNAKPGAWPAEPADPEKPFKWQTRRVVKPQPEYENDSQIIIECGKLKRIWRGAGMLWQSKTLGKVPYKPGDILWVRETFAKTSEGEYLYRADPVFDHCGKGDFGWKWSPSRHMPREAARMFLEVKGVRVERLQDISEADAKAEGVGKFELMELEKIPSSLILLKRNSAIPQASYKAGFYKVWEELNAKRGYGWTANPYVYVYEFMRLDPEGVM
jgi:hypothetical protein